MASGRLRLLIQHGIFAQVFALFAFSSPALAQGASQVPQTFVVEGRLYDNADVPIASEFVNIKLEIIDPRNNCVLYRENHNGKNVNADNDAAKGIFAVALGDGSNPTTATGVTLTSIFTTQVVAGDGCFSQSTDRSLKISVDADGNDGNDDYKALLPNTRLLSAPSAIVAGVAKNSEALGGVAADNFLQQDSNGELNQSNLADVFSGTNFPKLTALLNGTSTQYLPYSPGTPVSLNGQKLTNIAAPVASSDAATKGYSDSKLGGRDLSSAMPTSGQVLKWNGSAWAPAADLEGMTALTGDVTASGSGSVVASISANAVTSAKIANDAISSAKIESAGIAVNRLLITDGTTGTDVIYASCASVNQVMAWTATGWACTSVSALAPVTSVAGKTGAVSLNANDIMGLGTAALKNHGIAANEVVALDASARLPAVDGVQLTNVSAVRLKSGSVVWNLPAADGAANQVLTTNGLGVLSWSSPAAGTVTSVGASAPLMSTGGSTPTLSLAQASNMSDGFLSSADWSTFNDKAPLASPAFTGTPTAPTAAANTSTTQIATTEFVMNQGGMANPLMNGTADPGTNSKFSRVDHVHPTDTTRAPASGSSALTTVGTITAGTWNGSVIDVNYGGTGSNNGSITGTGSLMFQAGGTDQNVTLSPSGTGATILNGNVGIGTSLPGAKLDVTGDLRLRGTGSGSVTLSASPSASMNVNYTLPAADGSANQVLTTNGSGVLSWSTVVASGGGGGSSTTYAVTAPLAMSASGSTTTLSLSAANTTTDGYLTSADWNSFSGKAPLESPTFTGTPMGPTAAVDTNDTQLATTAYVLGQASGVIPLMNGSATAGTAIKWSRADHVHPTDSSRAPAAGSADITTLGTITSGTWNGSTIGVTFGGTGSNNGSITGTGALIFASGGNNENVTLTPSGSGATILNGNVGIGTNSPRAALDVNSTGAMIVPIGDTATQPSPPVGGMIRFNSSSSKFEFYQEGAWKNFVTEGTPSNTVDGGTIGFPLYADQGSVSTPSYSFLNNADTGLSAPAADTLVLSTNGLDRLHITPSGQVGIGIATPLQTLDVNGSIRSTGSILLAGSTSGTTGFQAAATTGSTVWTLPIADGSSGQVLTTDGSGILSWSTPAASGMTALTGSGPISVTTGSTPVVSITQASPTADGYLSSTDWNTFNSKAPAAGSNSITTVGTITTGTWNGDVIDVANGGTGSNNGSIQGSGPLVFTAGGANNNITLTPSGTGATILNGNVGIGTSAPGAKLEVNGAIRWKGATSGYAGLQASADAGSTVWTLPSVDGTSGQVLTTDGSGILSWSTPSGGGGSSTTVAASAPLTANTSGSTTTLSLPVANSGANGYLSSADWSTFNSKAPVDSPVFTGSPAAPTAAQNTNTAQIATTSFVLGQASNLQPIMNGSAAAGTGLTYSRADHVHPTDISRAPAEGSNEITTLGNITTGEWNATTIAVGRGGTGSSTGSITGTGALTFAAGGTNQNVTLTPSGTGFTVLNGKVGIGTNAPQAALDIFGPSSTLLVPRGSTLERPVSPINGMIRYNSDDGKFEFAEGGLWKNLTAVTSGGSGGGSASVTWPLRASGGGDRTSPMYSFTGDNDSGLFSPGADQIAFSTSAAERLRINDLGNVGIGTDNPLSKLDVNGALSLRGTTSGYSGFKAADTTTSSVIYTLPPNPGLADQVLKTDGSGVLTWTSILTSVNAASPLTVTSGGSSITIELPMATADQDGYLSKNDWTSFNNRAPLNSPTFTGTPIAPNADPDTNSTQIATTAFVLGQAANSVPTMNGAGGPGEATRWSRADHQHPTDQTRAPASGSTDIQVLGTIQQGTWNGTKIAVDYGGTGSTNGSIAGTGALTLASGGMSENITLAPSGSGKTVINSAVGIGTNAPQAALDIFSDGAMIVPRGPSSTRPSGAGLVNGMIRYNTDNGKFEAYEAGQWKGLTDGTSAGGSSGPVAFPLMADPTGDAGSPAYSFNGNADTGMFSPATDTIAFTNNGNESLRIAPNGNVGIGIGANLDAKLTVAGDVRWLSAGTMGNYTGFKSADGITSSILYTLPEDAGNNGQVLTTDGNGGLSWTSSSGGGGGGGSSLTGTAPIQVSSGAISIPRANSTTSGYIHKDDWVTFNNKVSSTGANTINTVGTITQGNWNGGVIGARYGGTGFDGSSASSGKIPIGNGTGFTLGNIFGSTNRVIVSNSSGRIDLSLPQDIHSGASPTFVDLNLIAGKITATTTNASVELKPNGLGTVVTWNELRVRNSAGGYVGFKVPSTGATQKTWTFPVQDGANGMALVTNGAGTLEFKSAASNEVPLMNGTASEGVGQFFSRDDHVHPSDTSRVPMSTFVLIGASSNTYAVSAAQSHHHFIYTRTEDGTLTLPAPGTLPDGFQVTVSRNVANNLTITPNSSTFSNGANSLSMRSQNLATVTMAKIGAAWTILSKVEDCIVGESCRTLDTSNGMRQVYVGSMAGYQYFTTPGGCTDSTTPTCAGGPDAVKKKWDSGNSLQNENNSFTDGKAQSGLLATQFVNTDAAKYCENMEYAGYTDWYLPAKEELNMLLRNSASIGGILFVTVNGIEAYWTSTEDQSSAGLKAVGMQPYSGAILSSEKSGYMYNVRCVRRF